MDESKKEKPRANIHTVSYQSKKEPSFFTIRDIGVLCDSPLPTKYGENWSFKINAEKAFDYVTKEKMWRYGHAPRKDTMDGQSEALRILLRECGCPDADLRRLDFKFDWKETPYKDLERFNRFLTACFEVSRGAGNTYETKSIMRKETKGLKASTKSYEVEYYDKEEQAPITAKKSKVKGRLELRNKNMVGVNKSPSVTVGISKLKGMFDELKEAGARAEEKQNEILLEYWEKEGYTLRRWTTFFAVHEQYFYTLRQAKDFLRKVGKVNPEKAVSNFQQNNLKAIGRPPLLKENEFEKYVSGLSLLLDAFFFSDPSVPDHEEEAEEKMIEFEF